MQALPFSVRAIVFDLDDTLWPVAPVIRHAELQLYQWLHQHAPGVVRRYDPTRLQQRRARLVGTDPRFAYDLWSLRHTLLCQVLQECGEPLSKADVAMQVFAEARNAVALFADVRPALGALQEKYRLGSVSNGFADLDKIGLAPFFSVSLAAHRFGCAKPDPRIFLAACAALECAPHEVLFVGDDLRLDVQGAQAAGLRAAWMIRPGWEKSGTMDAAIVPDLKVGSLQDLLQWL